MKGALLVQLAAVGLSTAFVLPDQQLSNLRNVEFETPRPCPHHSFAPGVKEEAQEFWTSVKTTIEDEAEHVSEDAQLFGHHVETIWDNFLEDVEAAKEKVEDNVHEAYYEAKHDMEHIRDVMDDEAKALHAEIHNSVEAAGHHHHHHKPNKTVYELIASSNYTKTLAKLISEYDDLVEALNGTSANFTVFAPTDRAFKKIPKHAPKPSKEELKYILSYHVSPEFYPAGRILVSRTVPTLLKSEELGKKPRPQRLGTNIGWKGLTINFYSRVVAVDIFGTNGVIHGVDSILVPPPRILDIIDLLPGEFSTLELGLVKTGLWEKLNESDPHVGATFFAPSNFAFQKLGHSANAFLFSKYGLKYLKELLKYHVVPANTLYSDAFYKETEDKDAAGVPKGVFHVSLPTLLKDKSLGVDIARYGRFIEIKINAFSRVTVGDGVAKNGVIHGVDNVLIPPKKLDNGQEEAWDGKSEISVDELIERLSPVADDDAHEEEL